MVNTNSLLALLALGNGALALGPPPPDAQVTCSTRLGSKSTRNVPTYTSTTTNTVTLIIKVTTTPIVTVTPPARTKTVKKWSSTTVTVTGPTTTDVATITLTSTSYVTTTNVITETQTETKDITSTTTPTSTLPAPAGFTPVSQEPGYVPKVKARDETLDARAGGSIRCKSRPRGGPPSFYPPLYPQCVDCLKVVKPSVIKTVTYTAKPCTVTLRLKTQTITSTIVQTCTSTLFPPEITSAVTIPASTVITTSTDLTYVTTSTVTNTISIVAPTATFYAACGPENLVSTANDGVNIGQITTNTAYINTVNSIHDAYSCCVDCFNTPNCRSAFNIGSICYHTTPVNNVCTPGQSNGNIFRTNTNNNTPVIVSNGPCGLLGNGGMSL
ncbi:hypothetical protein PT974_09890 [Cladobotryum mycophilum]|uniref:Apple domain-containing protein n=1 Tax=Cladobotryum mycophilum TaxID=491253 RepID=A0ABR0SIM4_9HYPO